jgi:hypothetical protein
LPACSSTVQRRLSRKPAAGLVGHGRERRIVPQLIVVDQVLVAERDGEDALAEGITHTMADLLRTVL